MKIFQIITFALAGSLAVPAPMQAHIFSGWFGSATPAHQERPETKDSTPWYVRHKGKISAIALIGAIYAYVRLNPTSDTAIKIKEHCKDITAWAKESLSQAHVWCDKTITKWTDSPDKEFKKLKLKLSDLSEDILPDTEIAIRKLIGKRDITAEINNAARKAARNDARHTTTARITKALSDAAYSTQRAISNLFNK